VTSRAPARRAGWAVIAAAVLLAVFGASVGHVLGRSALAEAGTDGPGGASPAASSDSSGSGSSGSGSSGPGCPDETQRALAGRGVSGSLQLVLYVETDASEVWICRSGNGRLWYQGHRLSGPGQLYPRQKIIEGTNGLLLANVNAITQGRYVAANSDNAGTTRYTVSRAELVITFSDGREEKQGVVRSLPPP